MALNKLPQAKIQNRSAIDFSTQRIKQLSGDDKKKLLYIDGTEWENFLDLSQLNDYCEIKKLEFEFNNQEVLNTIQDKFDIIFAELPIGMFTKSLNFDYIYELLNKYLKTNGVALIPYSKIIFNKEKMDILEDNIFRHRENVLGKIYAPWTFINVSIFEFKKLDKDSLESTEIEICDLQDFDKYNRNISQVPIYSQFSERYLDGSLTMFQKRLMGKFKVDESTLDISIKGVPPEIREEASLEFVYLADIIKNFKLVNLTKRNPRRSTAVEELKSFKNVVFIPTMPSKSDKNKIETDHTKLNPWLYFAVELDENKAIAGYVSEFLNSEDGKTQLIHAATGSIMPSLRSNCFNNIVIINRALEKQKKIQSTRGLIDKKIKQLLSVNLDDENEVEKTLMTLSDNANDYQKINHLEESEILERKSSLRYDTKSKNYQNYITDSALKTIVAFLNTNGGDLVIGVDDDKNLLGIEIDKFKNADAWTIYLKDKIKTNIGLSFLKEKIKISTLEIQDKTIGLITCKKLDGGEKAFLNGTDFYVRTGPATEKLSVKDAFEWDKQRKN